MSAYTEKLLEKLRESTAAVLPIVGIVLVVPDTGESTFGNSALLP